MFFKWWIQLGARVLWINVVQIFLSQRSLEAQPRHFRKPLKIDFIKKADFQFRARVCIFWIRSASWGFINKTVENKHYGDQYVVNGISDKLP
jgi:hypothetical protein